jgi:hypothetical protein
MPRAIYRLSDDVPSPWLRPALFRALQAPLAEIGVDIVLGRPGTTSGITDLADELGAAECAALADEVHAIVGRVIATRPARTAGDAA